VYAGDAGLALAAGIASQAAVAVENARLFTQVKEERENLTALINAMPIPVLALDRADKVMFANQKAQKVLKIAEEDVQLDDVEGGSHLKACLAELRDRAEHHLEMRWNNGQVFNVSMNQVAKLGTVLALDDITYLKELDAMKSQFVETVSHDLKSPLSTIIGFGQLLQHEQKLSTHGQKNVDGILGTAKQMQALIGNLLDLAQIEAGLDNQLEPCDMRQIVELILPNFEMQAQRKGLELSAQLPPEPAQVQGNSLRLSQVITNLVGNAIKYTPSGGRIDLILGQKSNEICFKVADTGPGISTAAQAQLFQKFYRVPEIQIAQADVDGTGLGLSIVKAIVEGYGGRVWVESQVGVGSTFGCILPGNVQSPD